MPDISQLGRHASDAHSLLDVLDEGGMPLGTPPSEAEFATPYAAPGSEAALPLGLLYQADWKIFADGIAKHAREQVMALAQAGVPLMLQSVGLRSQSLLDAEIHEQVAHEVGHLARVTLRDVAVAIRQVVIHNADFLRGIVLPKGARLTPMTDQMKVYESTIMYTSLERDRVAADIVSILNRCGQVWVPCKANSEALLRSGVLRDKVHIVPCPYDPSAILLERVLDEKGKPTGDVRAHRGVSSIPEPRGNALVPDGKLFYTVGKWEPRKGHARLLLAFLLAFTPKDRAALFLKTHGFGKWEGYPSLEEAMAEIAKDPRVSRNGWGPSNIDKRVRIVASKISDAAIVKIHEKNNIYVSASHGEAVELGAFDARCAGNRLVYVPYGGPEEYAGPGDVAVQGVHMAPVHADYKWGDAEWADYDLDALIEALRSAEPPSERVHPKDFNARFGRHAVGRQMAALVQKIDPRLAGAEGFA